MIEVKLLLSPLKHKKWRAILSNGKTIDFGAKGSSDFTLHQDPSRKIAYLKRHSGISPNFYTSRRENWTFDGIETAGFWSRWLLWNKPSITLSIKDIHTSFPIKIKRLQVSGEKNLSLKQQFIKESKGVYTPDKYFYGLTDKEKLIRLKRIKEGTKTKSRDQSAYRDFKTDFRNGERIKTKTSQYTKQWKKYFPGVTNNKEKSQLTGVPLDIIQKVYKKGAAAWRTGHVPGATTQQWGHARVNSFLVKGKAFYTSDHYLAKEAVKHPKAKQWFRSIDGLCDKPNQKKWCKDEVIDYP